MKTRPTPYKFPKCKQCGKEKYLNEHGVCTSCAKPKEESHGQ